MEGICGKELIVVMSCIYNNYLNRNNTWITDNTVFSCIEKPTISIFDYLGRYSFLIFVYFIEFVLYVVIVV